jgi:hypothetical protein
MSTHTPTPSVTPAPRAPTRSHRVAGPAAWILGALSTALTTVFGTRVVFAALGGEFTGPEATVVFLIMGLEVVVLAIFWVAFLAAFLALRRDGGVTRPGFWSAVGVGIPGGAILLALLV